MNAQFVTSNNVSFRTERPTGNEMGKVTLTIHGVERTWKDKKHLVVIDYSYVGIPDGEEENIVIKRSSETISEEEMNALSSAITPMIPTGLSDSETFAFKIITGSKMKFAETFGINTSDIEEVIE